MKTCDKIGLTQGESDFFKGNMLVGDWPGEILSLPILLMWQAVVVYLVALDKIDFAFWTVFLPPFIHFSLCNPKKAVAFLFLFTILDNTPMTKVYEPHFIHSIIIGGHVYPVHFLLIVLLISCWSMRSLIRGSNILKNDIIGILILIFISTWVLKYIIITWSLSAFLNITVILMAIPLSLYFLFVAELRSEKDLFYVMKAIWVASFIMFGYGWYQLITGNIYYTKYVQGVLGQDIAIGMYFPLFAFLAYSFNRPEKGWRFLAILLLILFFVLLPFTYKRAAFLGAIIGSLVAFWLIFRDRRGKRFIPIAILAAFVILTIRTILSIGFISSDITGTTKEQLQRIVSPGTDLSALFRIAQWYESFEVIKNNPAFGLSPAQDFIVNLGPYRLKNVLDCDYLHLAVFGGLFTLLVFLALLIAFFIIAFKSLRLAGDNLLLKSLLIGAISTVAGISVTSFFHVNLSMIRTMPFLMMCFALASVASRVVSRDSAASGQITN